MKYRSLAITITGILLGFLVVLQSRSFQDVQNIFGRDTRANVFREIQILKRTNENLQDGITQLIDELAKASNQEEALKAIEDEIRKDRLLAGHLDISGPGIELMINNNVQIIWLTDITNELWSAGAEAISVNNIRLSNSTIGFDTLPSGQIALNGAILSTPYVFKAIGDKKVLSESLNQRQGILDRLQQSIPNADFALEQKDNLKMEKVF